MIVKDSLCTDVIVKNIRCKDVIVNNAFSKDVIVKNPLCKDVIVKNPLCKDVIVKNPLCKDVRVTKSLCKDVVVKGSLCTDVIVREEKKGKGREETECKRGRKPFEHIFGQIAPGLPPEPPEGPVTKNKCSPPQGGFYSRCFFIGFGD